MPPVPSFAASLVVPGVPSREVGGLFVSDVISILSPETPSEPKGSAQIPIEQPEQSKPTTPDWYTRITRIMLIAATVLVAAGMTVLVYYYVKFARLTEQKLRTGVFAGTLNIFAGPHIISVGDHLSLTDALAYLRENGYSESHSNPVGWFGIRPNAVAIFPGHESYSDQEPAVIHFSGSVSDSKIAHIVSLADNTERQEYQFPPQLLTNQSDRNREKRRLVDSPKSLPRWCARLCPSKTSISSPMAASICSAS